jgi:hypothetical protein
MTRIKSIAAFVLVGTLLLGVDANAQSSCFFYAPDSTNYNTNYESESVYGYGPVSFVWEPSTGRILGGYYPERVIRPPTVTTYFNNLVAGTITAGPVSSPLNLSVSMLFSRSVPDSYWFELTDATLTGTTSSATLSGMLDGPFLLKATGTVNCN